MPQKGKLLEPHHEGRLLEPRHGSTFAPRHYSNLSVSTARGRGRELSREEYYTATSSLGDDDDFAAIELARKKSEPPPAWCCKSWPVIKKTMIRLFLPIGMLFFVVFGAIVPQPGIEINKVGWKGVSHASDFCIGIIFFISGLKLANDEVMNAVRNWPSMIYGLFFILFLSPWLGCGFAAFNIHSPAAFPPEFVLALVVFLCTPTTVTSCVVLTAEAYGNKSLAMMLTTICNFVGVFTLPLLLPIVLKTSSDPGVTQGVKDLDQPALIENLVETLFIPLFLGKTLLEMSSLVRRYARRYNTSLKVISNFALIVIIWVNASTNADQLRRVNVASVVVILFLGIFSHVILLVVNYGLAKYLMRTPEAELKALVMVCSQKSEVISLAVLPQLGPSFGDAGLLTIGFLIVYLPMLVIDGFIAYYWAKQYDFKQKVIMEQSLLLSVKEENNISSTIGSPLSGGSRFSSMNLDSSEKKMEILVG